jgi:hypothetical protein
MLWNSVQADDIVDKHACKGRGIDYLRAGLPMFSLCHVVDKRFNAVVALS